MLKLSIFSASILLSAVIAESFRLEHIHKSLSLVPRDDSIPSSPPWESPDFISAPPPCVATSTNCPLNDGALASQCSASKCTETLFGGCLEHDTLVDMSCVCPQLNATACSCADGIQLKLSLRWLNSTCGWLSGWNGLPPNWATDFSNLDLIPIANTSNDFYSPPDYEAHGYLYPGIFEAYWFPDGYIPAPYISTECLQYTGTLLSNTTYNGTELNLADPSNPYPNALKGQGPWGAGLYLDQTAFCLASYTGIPSNCNSGLDRTGLLLWMGNLCQNGSAYGWPSNWLDQVVVFNSTYQVEGEYPPPKCASSKTCFPVINSTRSACDTNVCVYGEVTPGTVQYDWNGDAVPYPITGLPQMYGCTALNFVRDKPCYCGAISYAKTCNSSCKLWWERSDYLTWMDNSCSSSDGWNGLPEDWQDLLEVQPSELLPWQWQIRQDATVTATSGNVRHCPSAGAKLGAFAAVNIAMAVLTPILGRRDVVQKLSLGRLGHQGSKLWLLTGPLSALLHISSNAIAATLIKHTPGYSKIDVGNLILLWCTRPRIAWLVIVLIPWGAKDHIYFSVAASTLVAEVAMQIIGSVYMGLATQYARKQKFYRIGMLTSVPRGKDALVMYAGSLLWLTVIAFAILACLSSVLGVSQYVSSLGRFIRGASRKARKQRKTCQSAMRRLLRAKQKAVNFEAIHQESLRQTYQVQPKVSDEYEELIRGWRETTRMSQKLVDYIDKDGPAFHKQEMKTEKLSKRLNKINTRGQTREHLDFTAEAQRSIANFEQRKNYMNSLPPQELETIEELNWISQARGRVQRMRSTTVLNFEYAQEDDMAMATPPTAALNVLVREMDTLKNLWAKLESVLEALSEAWAEQNRARQQEEAKRHEDPSSRLRTMAAQTVVGMIGCWIAQWIWWIGYIRVSGDAYCPPNLSQVAALWTGFSVIGALFGSSL